LPAGSVCGILAVEGGAKLIILTLFIIGLVIFFAILCVAAVVLTAGVIGVGGMVASAFIGNRTLKKVLFMTFAMLVLFALAGAMMLAAYFVGYIVFTVIGILAGLALTIMSIATIVTCAKSIRYGWLKAILSFVYVIAAMIGLVCCGVLGMMLTMLVFA
jgi:hypothetical protein